MRTHLAKAKEHLIAVKEELRLVLTKASPIKFLLMSQWVDFVHHNIERCKVFEDVMDAELGFHPSQNPTH